MGSLLTSLINVAGALRTVQEGIDVSSNNVTNSNTPGYAKQKLTVVAQKFDLQSGLIGGVIPGPLVSSRDQFLEASVRQQTSKESQYSQVVTGLQSLVPTLDISQGGGIGGAIDNLTQAFSQWSISPNDTPTRQTVIQKAQDLASIFNNTAAAVLNVSLNVSSQVSSVTDKINQIGKQIQAYNQSVRQDASGVTDPGLDSQINQNLADLAKYTDFQAIRAADGSYTIDLGGQTTLVTGEHVYPISTDASTAQIAIRDANGTDITGQLNSGQLRGLLDLHNETIPSVTNDLNTLAQTVADQVNSTLSGGVDINGQTPSTDLFSYNTVVGAAASISVNAITTDQLAAALPSAPGGNGNALALTALGTAKQIDGYTLSQFYAQIGTKVGSALATAQGDEQTQASLLTQAQNLRQHSSGVSLDEEAASLIAFQRQYQANGQLVSVLNSLLDTTLGLLK